jgi:hypothetical protein
MQVRTVCVILIGVIFVSGSRGALHAQDATIPSDGQACTVVRSYFSSGFKQAQATLYWSGAWQGTYYGGLGTHRGTISGGEPTPSGIRFLTSKQEISLDYKSIRAVLVAGNYINFDIPKRARWDDGVAIQFFSAVDDHLVQALNKFVRNAHAGHAYDCHSTTPAVAAKELADFQKKAAAWRAMDPKPPVSDEVTKKRLLAEDAVQEKNFGYAVDYYNDGVTIDPAWAPGWYNAALISAELKDYAAAALYMKHYLILLPDASDAAAAKEKVLLWEAKAEETNGK